jgi:transglutaminase-like putative cysteine protease
VNGPGDVLPRRDAFRLIAAAAAAPLAIPRQATSPVQAQPPAPLPLAAGIRRDDPLLFDVTFEVALSPYITAPVVDPWPVIASADFILPLVPVLATSEIDRSSLKAEVLVRGRHDAAAEAGTSLADGRPFGHSWATIPARNFAIDSLRWRVKWRQRSFTPAVDEAVLRRSTWPREWPADARDFLKPQTAIESDAPIFADFVRKTAGERLRQVSPYLAAKDLVRATCTSFRGVDTSGLVRHSSGAVLGLKLNGAARSATEGKGSSHDLVAACVAVLRAAGIPARPVIAVWKDIDRLAGRPDTILVSWGEFLVPGAGWVVFDPLGMRRGPLRSLDVNRPWDGFGAIDDLNEACPFCYAFGPEGAIWPYYPAVWGAQPTAGTPAGVPAGFVTVSMSSRGKG